MNRILPAFFLLIFLPVILPAQYAPPAGQPGTTAIHKDSSAIIGWASTCSITRGYINIADTTVIFNDSNRATFGSYLYATGPADNLVVSLGDHGVALLGFADPVVNIPGPDLAVFENSFGDTFLELAFVEVSSDGNRFVRFPAVSLTPSGMQISTFDTLDATRIHNLAGKYRAEFGTPFDLEEIRDSTGLDIGQIKWVRITDAGGCIQPPFASYDSQGHVVNEPWPTPFNTGGFDLDAVAAISVPAVSGADFVIKAYPVPVSSTLRVISGQEGQVLMELTDCAGRKVMETEFHLSATFDLSTFPAGIFIARFSMPDGSAVVKKIVKRQISE